MRRGLPHCGSAYKPPKEWLAFDGSPDAEAPWPLRPSPWRGRAAYAWPGGARLAVYLGVNLEGFSFGEGLGAELAPGGPAPDVLNFAWRDYGNALHPYIIGQPYRMRALRRALAHVAARRDEVWLCTAGQVFEHIAGLPAGLVPGA